ncbi:MAG: hypothetical protein HRT40_09340 [Campylobacteraceae bacterium]|nr:hypothetical protein [Campylobacteraceae bacterium]
MSNKINEILDYGLLSEFAYLTLESKYYKVKLKNIYTNENIIKYLKVDNDEIKEIDKEYFIDNPDKDAHDYRDIKSSRLSVMIDLLEDYSLVDFTSDDGFMSSDFQSMAFKNNSTKKNIVSFRGTDCIADREGT